MKKLCGVFFIAVSVFAVLALKPVSAAAADVRLGVVDLNKVLQASVAAQGLEAQLDKKRKEFEQQIADTENKLRAAEKEIQVKKDKLSSEELAKESKAFQKKLVDAQQDVVAKKRLLDRAFAQSMDKLRLETRRVVSEIAHNKKLSAVLTQDSVILSLPEMDLTDEVIKALNGSVKSISVDWNAAKAKKAG